MTHQDDLKDGDLLRSVRAQQSARAVQLSNCPTCDPKYQREAESSVQLLDRLIKDLEDKI